MALLNPGIGPGLLGGGQQPVLPRVPFGQNPMVTTAALSLLGGRNLNEGLSNVAQSAPYGMQAKSGMQQFMLAQQERDKAKAEADARRAQMNEALKNWPGLSPEQKAIFTNQPELFGQYAVSTMKPPDQTSDVRNYLYGQADPNFIQHQLDMKQAGAQRSVGPPQPGWRITYDNAGNPVSQEPIPGSPAAREAEAAQQQSQVGGESQAVKAGTMLDATQSIKDEFKNATMPVTGTFSRPFAVLSSTGAGRVRSYVGSLKSGVALQAILKLKEASSTGATGFGALSAPELALLVDDIGSLDPDNTEPDIFLKTIDRIEARWKSILQDVERTVPPERLAEMGIDIEALVDGTSGDEGWTEVEPGVRIREIP